MKVAIIGYGFVGKALENGFKENVETFLVDPKLKTEINELNSFLPEIIFICVPTPMNDDGTQMISILQDVISKIFSFLAFILLFMSSVCKLFNTPEKTFHLLIRGWPPNSHVGLKSK